jgi:hypothetical protein
MYVMYVLVVRNKSDTCATVQQQSFFFFSNEKLNYFLQIKIQNLNTSFSKNFRFIKIIENRTHRNRKVKWNKAKRSNSKNKKQK